MDAGLHTQLTGWRHYLHQYAASLAHIDCHGAHGQATAPASMIGLNMSCRRGGMAMQFCLGPTAVQRLGCCH